MSACPIPRSASGVPGLSPGLIPGAATGRPDRGRAWWSILLALLVALAAGVLPDGAALAQSRTPLLMEGRQTLYQRVLSRPSAILREGPSPTARATVAVVAPFTIYYVFGRQTVGGQDWVEVGRPERGPAEGWVQADQVIDWRQTLVVAFTNPAGRERTLFFRDRDSLMRLLESPRAAREIPELRRQAIERRLPPGSPVISIEPAEFIDITRQFYVLPILAAEQTMMPSGFTTRALRVASIPLREDPLSQMPSAEELLRNYRVGIVFVIDTTVSMGPYIDRTRAAVRRIYGQIAGSPIAQRVSFGMIGFRDRPDVRPGLEYLTRVYLPLERNQDARTILARLDRMEEASVSSPGWNEDALAGIHAALQQPGWSDFDGRYIILITDAGPRLANDPISTTLMGPREISALAQQNHTAIYALHLLTSAGRDDHDFAAAQYRELSRWPNTQPLYYPVPQGSVTEFGRRVDQLAESLIAQANTAMQGRLVELQQEAAAGNRESDSRTQLVGRAMQLAFLGRVQGTRAPDVFEAWTTDRDLDDPRRASLDVRVLLTKSQLSDLRDVLRAVLEQGQANRLSPQDFFGQLRSAVANMTRDPGRLGRAQFANLGELLGEYLRDLPYTSRILEIDERTWMSMGPGAQREVLDDIAAKLRLYQQIHDRPELWTALYEGAPEGERVYPMPLDSLP